MRVFKYTDHHAVDVLRDRRVKVSLAHELNDPFELSPTIDPSFYTIERAMSFMRQDHQVSHWFWKEGVERGFTSKEKFKRWYLRTVPSRAKALMHKVPENIESTRENFARLFSEYWRLFCVSERDDSVLMWSHYAAEHHGAVIEFEMNEPRFKDLGSDYILRVEYGEKKVPFAYEPDEFEESLLRVVKAKSQDWSYEKEVRVVIPKNVCQEGKFFSFAPSAIKGVTLGCRCDDELKGKIREQLSTTDFRHVTVRNATLSRDEYRLVIESAT